MEKRTPKITKQTGVHQTCDNCSIGEMIYTGAMKLLAPPLYEHQCNQCGHYANYKTVYPHIKEIKMPIDIEAVNEGRWIKVKDPVRNSYLILTKGSELDAQGQEQVGEIYNEIDAELIILMQNSAVDELLAEANDEDNSPVKD